MSRTPLYRALAAGTLLAASVPSMATDHAVAVGGSGLVFTPSDLTVAAGDTVTFTNAGGFHNVVSDDGAITTFSSGSASTDPWTLTVAFPTPGTVAYHCAIHGGNGGAGMSGMIHVSVPVELQSFDVD